MTTITNSITVGSAAYPSPLTLSSTELVAPSASAATAVYMEPAASLNNHGRIVGGASGGGGVYLSSGSVSNGGTISGGTGSTQGGSTTDGG